MNATKTKSTKNSTSIDYNDLSEQVREVLAMLQAELAKRESAMNEEEFGIFLATLYVEFQNAEIRENEECRRILKNWPKEESFYLQSE